VTRRNHIALLRGGRSAPAFRVLQVFAALVFCCVFAKSSLAQQVIRDEEIEQDLKAFTRPIFAQAGVSPDAVRFVILENNELNAFVAGGQNIFLHTGLILQTANVAELIGVVAHETGHIAHGDLIRTAATIEHLSIETLVATLVGIAAAAAARSGDAAMAAASAPGSIAERAFLTHSREQETAADQAGVQFLEGADLPTYGFLTFMRKLQGQELLPSSEQSQYVRTHPLTQDRVSYLQGIVEAHPRQPPVPANWVEMHRRIKAKLMGYLFPDLALLNRGEDIASQYGRAIAVYRKGDADKAVRLIDPLIRAEPQNPYFYELKGQALFEYGHIDDSLKAYAKAVEYAPLSGLIRASYGHALLEAPTDQAAHEAEAVRQLTLSLRTEPLEPQTHHFLAIAYGKQGNEGLSRLHLAEEGLMLNKPDVAIKEARLAEHHLPKNSPSALRAADIIDLAKELAAEIKKARNRG
jgi:predicted Zn-dependent protease